MITKTLSINDTLPLTCSRTGTCCHGKQVFLNPWELYTLAIEKGCTTIEFSDRYCELGGIRLRFDGKAGWKNYKACSQYIEEFGCSVHLGRPLACRLFPLGRQLQGVDLHYIFEGSEFPCLEGCPEVENLPKLSVKEYLDGQQAERYEQAQDAYIEVMQSIADIAFELLLDTGLAESGDKETLKKWEKMGTESADMLLQHIGDDWINALMTPEIAKGFVEPLEFIQQHSDLLQFKAQTYFGAIESYDELHQASVRMMAVALHLARALGIKVDEIAQHWIATARENGAL